VYALGVVVVLGYVISAGVAYYVRGPSVYGPGSGSLHAAELARVAAPAHHPIELTVMTFNVAHGRADGHNQAFLKKQTIVGNLDKIASAVREVSPDIVALEEADGPSMWSGRFNHVAHLAEAAGYEQAFRGEHVSGLKLSYGTALLSHYPLENRASITFAPSPPTFTKGFVVGEISVPGCGPITVVAVHLDFARESVREEQVKRLVEELAERPRPMIMMGDFNCDWDDEATLPTLAEQLDLRVFEPDSTTTTFPKLGKRLDWIFVSDEIEFVGYEVGEEGLSDHRPVIARLRIGGQ
jgi:endonuclease/exonuclease/phosphatase family metal-dependent hydrolase